MYSIRQIDKPIYPVSKFLLIKLKRNWIEIIHSYILKVFDLIYISVFISSKYIYSKYIDYFGFDLISLTLDFVNINSLWHYFLPSILLSIFLVFFVSVYENIGEGEISKIYSQLYLEKYVFLLLFLESS